jgi:hypothetical protein
MTLDKLHIYLYYKKFCSLSPLRGMWKCRNGSDISTTCYQEGLIMENEECIGAARREFFIDIMKELRELHGQPMHGLRTRLLERLGRKYPRVTFESVDKILKDSLDPCDYKLLTD